MGPVLVWTGGITVGGSSITGYLSLISTVCGAVKSAEICSAWKDVGRWRDKEGKRYLEVGKWSRKKKKDLRTLVSP